MRKVNFIKVHQAVYLNKTIHQSVSIEKWPMVLEERGVLVRTADCDVLIPFNNMAQVDLEFEEPKSANTPDAEQDETPDASKGKNNKKK